MGEAFLIFMGILVALGIYILRRDVKAAEKVAKVVPRGTGAGAAPPIVSPSSPEKPARVVDYSKYFSESGYRPTCGTPYFHCPDDPLAWTHKGVLLIDPVIAAKFRDMGPKSLVNNKDIAFKHLVGLAGMAEDSGGCRIERQMWWDDDGNTTPAKYRPYILFGVEPYDFDDPDVEECKVEDGTHAITLHAPTTEEIRDAIDSFDKLTRFAYTMHVDEGDD